MTAFRHFAFTTALVASLACAAPAAADGLFTPYFGGTFGGYSPNGKAVFGASIGFMSAGVFGLEADLGHSPDFLNTSGGLIFEAGMTTAMVNLVLGVPVGGTAGVGFRPYMSAGAGIVRAKITSPAGLFQDLSRGDPGVNIGAGVIGFFNDHLGLRGDVRYFRAIQDDDERPVGLTLGDFNFTRATAGLTFRF